MAVKCPVRCIMKQRKLRGRDYFEVCWEDMEVGSAVPAHLVESACPEKMVEFQQRKAVKQKPRKKKVETREEMKEIDEKLQELVLDLNGSRALEVIDLVSPAPPQREKVIELKDTDDDDVSPQHARKARELRLFIASIRD